MTSLEATRLSDTELLARYRDPPDSATFRAAADELERRVRRDGGWWLPDMILLTGDQGGVEVVPLVRQPKPDGRPTRARSGEGRWDERRKGRAASIPVQQFSGRVRSHVHDEER